MSGADAQPPPAGGGDAGAQGRPVVQATPVNAQPPPPPHAGAPQGLPTVTAVPAQPVVGQPYPGYGNGYGNAEFATITVVEQRELTPDEVYVLALVQSARITKILAIIDLVFTVITSIMQAQLFMLLLIFGPLAGLYAALKLNAIAAAAYGVFAVVKAIIDVVDLILVLMNPGQFEFPGFVIFVLLLSATVQVWIAKIVFRFRTLLTQLTPERMDDVQRVMSNPPPLMMRNAQYRRDRV